ncbi:MAG: hypothetical protein AAGL96_01360 [Pseudomonadota bacterium]
MQALHHLLSKAAFPDQSVRAANIGDIFHHLDFFLRDTFGVLNVGNTAIRGAVERVVCLQATRKRVLVLTNGAR